MDTDRVQPAGDDPRRRLVREHLARLAPSLDRTALERLPAHAPDWTGHSDSDPGITLLEMIAFVAEELLYRRMETSALPHTAENAEQLRDLLAVVAGELSSILEELERLYGDQFLATAGASLNEVRFPGVFVEEVPFRAKRIPGVSTTIDPGLVDRITGDLPVKVEAPDLNAAGNEVPIEPIELVTGQPEDPDPED
jgi:hypothetical protein